jgi:MCM P-loop domain
MQELAQEPDIYQKLAASVAPGIWQLDDIKKGLLCQLFGGTTKVQQQPNAQKPKEMRVAEAFMPTDLNGLDVTETHASGCARADASGRQAAWRAERAAGR